MAALACIAGLALALVVVAILLASTRSSLAAERARLRQHEELLLQARAEVSLARDDRLAVEVRAQQEAAALRAEHKAQLERERQERAAAEERLREVVPARAALEAQLLQERTASAEKLALLQAAEVRLADQFQRLSQQALRASNDQFLQLAEQKFARLEDAAKGELDKRQQAIDGLVKPVHESLQKVDEKVQQLEGARRAAFAQLGEQIAALQSTQQALRSETGNLVKALRAPAVRGRWGEIQLRRVCEMAGMLHNCDFVQQQSVEADEGLLRPDVVVRLPGGKRLVVDAKVPLAAYLEALEATDDAARRAHLVNHARQLRNHVAQLSRKAYWDQFEQSPEFVVLFVPNEAVFAAAMEQDGSLMETAVSERVLLASPTTLIALLRAAEMGWRQESLARDAQEIARLGRELHQRLVRYGTHFANIGKGLGNAVAAYNEAVGSLARRVAPAAKRLGDKVSIDRPDLELPPEVAADVREVPLDLMASGAAGALLADHAADADGVAS